ncbi:Peptidase, partial [Oryctes borbonicus]
FVDGHSRFDAVQGDKSFNCWVVASIANLSNYEELLHFVIPTDQDFEDKYAGIFHFRFWQYGRWVDVVIDDRLPYQKGKSKLFSVRSRQKNEFWSALLEKAYAKLHGSYEALNDGFALDAMEDFTGGISEVIRFPADPTTLYEILRKSYERGSLLTCSLRLKYTKGLQCGHAYSITNVRYVHKKDSPEKVPLLRLRNPWGLFEWNGPWSDCCTQWDSVTEEDKKALGVCVNEEGEFWMSFEDFERNYVRIEICNLAPLPSQNDTVDYGEDGWKVSFFEGTWVKNVTAGGRSCFQCK